MVHTLKQRSKLLKHLRNYVVGAALFAAVSVVVMVTTVFPAIFFFWLSNGELWGLPLGFVTTAALIGGGVYSFAAAKYEKFSQRHLILNRGT